MTAATTTGYSVFWLLPQRKQCAGQYVFGSESRLAEALKPYINNPDAFVKRLSDHASLGEAQSTAERAYKRAKRNAKKDGQSHYSFGLVAA